MSLRDLEKMEEERVLAYMREEPGVHGRFEEIALGAGYAQRVAKKVLARLKEQGLVERAAGGGWRLAKDVP